MANNASDYTEGKFIDHLYRTATWAKPTALYHALYTAAPGEAGGGTEVTGGSYARVNLAPLDANWAAPVSNNGVTSNLAAITFPAPTATWGTVTDCAQLDAATVGNFWTYGPLTASRVISNGDAAPSFAISAFQITIS